MAKYLVKREATREENWKQMDRKMEKEEEKISPAIITVLVLSHDATLQSLIQSVCRCFNSLMD